MIGKQSKILLIKVFILQITFIFVLSGKLLSEEKINNVNCLNLSQIIKKVKKQNRTLIANKWGVLAKDGEIIQASLNPNPEIEIEFGNFAGFGENTGIEHLETSVQIAQTVLLNGKKRKTLKLAKMDKVVSIRDYERELSELLSETKKKFIALLLIQEKFILREEMVGLAEKFLEKISVRVIKGRTSPVELSRAKVSLLRNKLILKRLEKEMFISHQKLTALWGGIKPGFEKIKGSLEISPVIPQLNKFKDLLSGNAILKLLSSEIEFFKSKLILQKAFRIPDPTFHAGIKRMNESKSTAFTINISVPIPLYNNNKGSIKTAEYILKKAEYIFKAVEIKLENDLITTYKMLQKSYNTSQMIKNKILPEAQKTFIAINRGYDQGKFGYLDVYETYKTLLEVKEEYLESKAEYWLIMANIEQISGIGNWKFSQ